MENTLDNIKSVFTEEAKALLFVRDKISESFVKAVDLIASSAGKVVISGIGKSGLVGRKISATLNSTGTYSIFLHPVEAMHGDLGILKTGDVFIGLSNSGETSELNIILSSVKRAGCPVVCFTGNTDSTLARQSDIVIDTGVEKEACPLNLAPTSSTTALLCAGDALASALILKKGFQHEDFKRFHPGGLLGKRLSMKVEELMNPFDKTPAVNEKSDLATALKILDKKNLGAVFIVGDNKRLKGVITDGDIRRLIVEGHIKFDELVTSFMTINPLRAFYGSPVYDALNLMESKQITVLPVVDYEENVVGILHLHDILGKGELKFSGQ
ncbi:MAG: KpsF/GutQ family sugar-phosphate isomerase [Desulfobacteraceae bacterium]|nr:KpsF/GutQ family sugar-phosphate isomerase [Desulfobacteraceae bacterium]